MQSHNSLKKRERDSDAYSEAVNGEGLVEAWVVGEVGVEGKAEKRLHNRTSRCIRSQDRRSEDDD